VADVLTLLDLDPNIVKPGWTPLLITIGLAAVMVLLFISLRKQFRTIEKNFPAPEPSAPTATTPGGPTSSAEAPEDASAPRA
jgi:hypothetical protein